MALDESLFFSEDSNGTPEEIDEDSATEEVEEEVGAEGEDPEETAEEDEENEGEEEELEVVEIDGKEVTLDSIRKALSSEFREQDYTKKTTALADQRKALEAKDSKLDEALNLLASSEDQFKLLAIGDLDEIDLDQLKKDDYSEYLRVKEEREARAGKVDAIKAKAMEARNEHLAEQRAQLDELLGWNDQAKKDSDIKLYQKFAEDSGFTEADARNLTSAKVMAAIVELARLKQAPKTAESKRKKVKVFKSSKSTAKAKSQGDTIEDLFFS
jgi:hypothetical protein